MEKWLSADPLVGVFVVVLLMVLAAWALWAVLRAPRLVDLHLGVGNAFTFRVRTRDSHGEE